MVLGLESCKDCTTAVLFCNVQGLECALPAKSEIPLSTNLEDSPVNQDLDLSYVDSEPRSRSWRPGCEQSSPSVAAWLRKWKGIDHAAQRREGGCAAAAWSPDGKWVYFRADPGRVKHIWRQRFPDGQPVQITSGPTEEEVIAMAPDGRSFVTAVALQNTSLWIHDPKASVRFPSKETTK